MNRLVQEIVLIGRWQEEWMFFLGQTDLWHITFFYGCVKKTNKMLFYRQIPRKGYVDQFMSRPANYKVLEGIEKNQCLENIWWDDIIGHIIMTRYMYIFFGGGT